MDNFRIATWNCNGALRKKFQWLKPFNADVVVVQECENPATSKSTDYSEWASNHVWTGTNKNKGLGVFARQGLSCSVAELDMGAAELLMPFEIDSVGRLLAVWTKSARPREFRYIAQIWRFLRANNGFLEDPATIMIGDFNSSALWDYKKNRVCNHTDVVRELSGFGMLSAYHAHHSLQHGKEVHPTYFMQRKADRSHHIDYCFFGKSWKVVSVEVGSPDTWLEHSDHMPMVFDLVRVS